MRNAKSLLGMPVLRADQKLGQVSYVLPDDELRQILGLYMHCGLTGSRFIEGSQLDRIDDVAVQTRALGRRASLNQRPLLRRALASDGRRIGAITDALIDEDTLRIEALELSHGYLDDITIGRTRVRQFSTCKNGDVIVEKMEGGNEA